MSSLPESTDKTEPNTVRVFFALWPDAGVRSALDRLGKEMHDMCGGRRTRAESIHITLAFLGEVEAARVAELQTLAAQLQFDAFDLELSHSGWWRHNRIAWVAPEAVPQALNDLVSALQSRLKSAGFVVDGRAYLPHVTLLRKAGCPRSLMKMLPIAWAVQDFVLVKSVAVENGSAYEIMGRWQLATDLDIDK